MSPPPLDSTRRELLGHRKAVLALSWSLTGRRLASGSADEHVRIWSIEAGANAKPERAEIVLMPSNQSGGGGAVLDVGWHPKREDQLALLTDKCLK